MDPGVGIGLCLRSVCVRSAVFRAKSRWGRGEGRQRGMQQRADNGRRNPEVAGREGTAGRGGRGPFTRDAGQHLKAPSLLRRSSLGCEGRVLHGRTGLLLGLMLGLAGGCTAAREAAMSNTELLDAVHAKAGDLRTRISYAERRADALKTRMKESRRRANEMEAGLHSAGIKVGPRGASVVVTLAGRLLFPVGDIGLRGEARKDLDKLAVLLNSRFSDRPVRVAGHTDAARPRHTAEDYATNWELSVARAVAVARYLIEAGGVRPERVSVAAYGDTRPTAPNDTREGRARNRRVEIVLLPPIGTKRVSARIE